MKFQTKGGGRKNREHLMWSLCFTIDETKTFPKVFLGLILILPPTLIWELCGIMAGLVIWQGIHTQAERTH